MSLLQDVKNIKDVVQTKRWMQRELIICITFIFLMIILAIPVYLSIPRLNLPVPLLFRLVKQKYALTYIDFPKDTLVSFLSPSQEQATEKKKGPEGTKLDPSALEGLINLSQEVIKPVFWHGPAKSPEGYKTIITQLNEEIEELNKEIEKANSTLSEISENENLPQLSVLMEERERLLNRKQGLSKTKNELQEERNALKKEFLEQAKIQNLGSLNQLTEKTQLKHLEQQLESVQKEIQGVINKLRMIEENLQRAETGIEEVRENVNKQAKKNNIHRQVMELWAKKEALEETMQSAKEAQENLEAEYKLYQQLVKEGNVPAETESTSGQYEENIKEIQKRMEENNKQIAKIEEQLSVIGEQIQNPQLETLINKINQVSQQKQELSGKESFVKQQIESLKKTADSEVNSKELEATKSNLENVKQELNKAETKKDTLRGQIFSQFLETEAGQKIDKLFNKKQVFEKATGNLNKELQEVEKQLKEQKKQEETREKQQETKPEKKPLKPKTNSIFGFMLRLLIMLLILILLYLISRITSFFFSYWRYKRKIIKAKDNNFGLFVVLIYRYLSKILVIFGFKHPVIITPEEYSLILKRRFKTIGMDIEGLTREFQEARYSSHQIIRETANRALDYYRKILKELKDADLFWQRMILKLNFLFKI